MGYEVKGKDPQKMTQINLKNGTKDRLLDMKFDFRTRTLNDTVEALIAFWDEAQKESK